MPWYVILWPPCFKMCFICFFLGWHDCCSIRTAQYIFQGDNTKSSGANAKINQQSWDCELRPRGLEVLKKVKCRKVLENIVNEMQRYFLCFWQESWFCHAKTRKKYNSTPSTLHTLHSTYSSYIPQISISLWTNIVETIIAELDDDNICTSRLFSLPHICPFWYTATLFRPIKSIPQSA